jgi:hypothetical protein
MPKQRLTDRQLISGVTLTDLLHFVVTGDTSQSPAGSSYKGNVEQLFDSFSAYTCTNPLTLDVVNACTTGITINGNTKISGSLNIGTVLGNTPIINLGLDSSGNVVTGTTGSVSDIFVTGGTFDNNTDTITFINTSGGTFDVTGITDTFVIAGTFNGTTNTLSLLRNDGNFVSITGVTDTFTGNTSGDCITDLYVTNLYGCSPITVNDSIQSVTSSATGTTSFAFGSGATASGDYSHAEGLSTQAIGDYSHAEGGLFMDGTRTSAIGLGSHAEGFSTSATTLGSHSEGLGTITYESYQHVSGRWNNTINENQYFIIGNGTSNVSRSNAFRVDSDGRVYGAGATYNSGADYAEYFESLSGDSIPYGTVVELEDGKIKICTDSNNAIGVISSNPTIIGNNEEGTADEWVGKYLKDEWGRYIMEDYQTEEVDYSDSSGNIFYKTVTRQRPKISDNFDPNAQYIPRSQRPEWNVVGLVGQVRILKNQQIPNRWIKMKDINDSIALYLIR